MMASLYSGASHSVLRATLVQEDVTPDTKSRNVATELARLITYPTGQVDRPAHPARATAGRRAHLF
ncbi:hypothetical protein DLJ61_01710 [Gordonia terrae]|uniref:Uncharacterized protein n=1 Tax=Gordonia terrae TaxID=2055 RepID=A0AAD0NVQ2_9ACTN|nr:hypothetical protein BCM27_01700 [Gordonia terrae]AWO82432.1 hypothetical protein DLJ61_01710 [Gordonia terrae]